MVISCNSLLFFGVRTWQKISKSWCFIWECWGGEYVFFWGVSFYQKTGSTIRTLLHGKINPKAWQVFSLGDVGFLLFFRVVSGDYGKPRKKWWTWRENMFTWTIRSGVGSLVALRRCIFGFRFTLFGILDGISLGILPRAGFPFLNGFG